MSKALRILGYLWATPLTLVCAVWAIAVYWPLRVRWSEGALDVECVRMVPSRFGAITFGWAICYRRGGWDHERRRRHEREHVAQGCRWGILSLIAYPVASLVAVLKGGHYYRDNAFERQARERAEG